VRLLQRRFAAGRGEDGGKEEGGILRRRTNAFADVDPYFISVAEPDNFAVAESNDEPHDVPDDEPQLFADGTSDAHANDVPYRHSSSHGGSHDRWAHVFAQPFSDGDPDQVSIFLPERGPVDCGHWRAIGGPERGPYRPNGGTNIHTNRPPDLLAHFESNLQPFDVSHTESNS